MNDLSSPNPFDFEEIRPYYDHEVNQVLQRLTEKTSLYALMSIHFPELSPNQVREQFLGIHDVETFQARYSSEALRRMTRTSISKLFITGLENIQKGHPYLFISNHRDIILDPGIFNERRSFLGYGTSKIAIGDNLLVSSLVTDLMKLNKSIIVHRSVPRLQLRAYSDRLSHYIRSQITAEGESVWIAQRSGRAKDGNDRTQSALLKMLALSGTGPLPDRFTELNIVPMALSYEFEPCDMLKAEELVHQKLSLPYQKDDKEAIIKGIREPKGRVQMSIGKPISHLIQTLPNPKIRNQWFQSLVSLLDEQIQGLYRLWPNNYIAMDLLMENENFQAHYSPEQKACFLKHIEKRLHQIKGPEEALRQQLLEIYANPVRNCLNLPVAG